MEPSPSRYAAFEGTWWRNRIQLKYESKYNCFPSVSMRFITPDPKQTLRLE